MNPEEIAQLRRDIGEEFGVPAAQVTIHVGETSTRGHRGVGAFLWYGPHYIICLASIIDGEPRELFLEKLIYDGRRSVVRQTMEMMAC